MLGRITEAYELGVRELALRIAAETSCHSNFGYSDVVGGGVFLTVRNDSGACELRIDRAASFSERSSTATLTIVATQQGRDALGDLLCQAEHLHSGTFWLQRSRRRFFHAVVTVARDVHTRAVTGCSELGSIHADRVARLQRLFPHAVAAVGRTAVAPTPREGASGGAAGAEESRPRAAAWIPLEPGGRAALLDGVEGQFCLVGAARFAAATLICAPPGSASVDLAATYGISNEYDNLKHSLDEWRIARETEVRLFGPDGARGAASGRGRQTSSRPTTTEDDGACAGVAEVGDVCGICADADCGSSDCSSASTDCSSCGPST